MCPESAQGIRGIRTLPDSDDLTAAELLWIQTEAAIGNFIYNEVPSGTIDGTNPTFTLAAAPTTGTLQLHLNGVRLKEGASDDFTLSGLTITTNYNPESGETLLADYRDPA